MEKEYKCNTIEEFEHAISELGGSGGVITCSDEIFEYAKTHGYFKEANTLDAIT